MGQPIHAFVADLYPLCRSLTGDGVRETLRRIGKQIPLQVREVPTGTQVLDWTVPREWNIRDAYVKDASGRRAIDFRASNLHVASYSAPVHTRVSLAELKRHLFSLPDHPDWIPHKTFYYRDDWGFSLRHRELEQLPEGEYEVRVDATLQDGHLTYGECLLPGETSDEVLVSCHVCHPSLCNDNLSGIGIATFLARRVAAQARRYSYRFLFIPATIGSITWLALNEPATQRIRHGLVLTCVGDAGNSTYKKSRRGDAEIDRVFQHVLKHSGEPYQVREFMPWGYDERQYCSPGFDLPVGCLMRTPHGEFPEYHTSADDLDFIKPAALADSLAKCEKAFSVLERNRTFWNTNPKGEPQLGRRGLYRTIGGRPSGAIQELPVLWVLNLSDGQHSLLDIAERSGMEFEQIYNAARALLECGLLAHERPGDAPPVR